MISILRAAPLHAACVSPAGTGMLLCGNSEAGKSSLVFAGARAGWTFICDDASYLLFDRTDRMVVGNCHQFRLRDSGVQLFPELEGRFITPRAAGKPSIEIFRKTMVPVRVGSPHSSRVQVRNKRLVHSGRPLWLQYTAYLFSRSASHASASLSSLRRGLLWRLGQHQLKPQFWIFLAASFLFDLGLSIYFFLFNLFLVNHGYTEKTRLAGQHHGRRELCRRYPNR